MVFPRSIKRTAMTKTAQMHMVPGYIERLHKLDRKIYMSQLFFIKPMFIMTETSEVKLGMPVSLPMTDPRPSSLCLSWSRFPRSNYSCLVQPVTEPSLSWPRLLRSNCACRSARQWLTQEATLKCGITQRENPMRVDSSPWFTMARSSCACRSAHLCEVAGNSCVPLRQHFTQSLLTSSITELQ